MNEIHFYRHEDLVIKKLSQDYGQEFLDYLDDLYHENHKNPVELPCKTIKTESSTELVTSSLKNMYMDFTYLLADDSILHFEHYSVRQDGSILHFSSENSIIWIFNPCCVRIFPLETFN